MDNKSTAPSDYRYFIHTFGCQMNENDSERIAGLLQSINARPASSLEDSNLIIINTCAVRQKSEEKLYSLLGRLDRIKRDNNAKIGVVGCVAQLHTTELIEDKPVIDFVIGPNNYNQLPGILSKLKEEKFVSTMLSSDWNEIPDSHVIHKSQFTAHVTIMEGCNNFCSYCIVPFTRGREKFRPKNYILNEIKSLAEQGFQEVILLGQNVNSYKDPDSAFQFPELLYEANRIEGIQWIRFITSHPKNFTEEIAAAMKENSKVCHQLHLPIQSGSSTVLNRMKRGYTRDNYMETIHILRKKMPNISLSTDIIVGYPGETDTEYEETLSLLQETRYTNIFSFRYSPRPQTSASKEIDSVPLTAKKQRLIELQAFQKEIQTEINQRSVGKTELTLCLAKGRKGGRMFTGRNEGYQVVNFDADKNVLGRFIDVEISSSGPYSLRGIASAHPPVSI